MRDIEYRVLSALIQEKFVSPQIERVVIGDHTQQISGYFGHIASIYENRSECPVRLRRG